MLPSTTLQEFYNLRWYIQHLIDETEYQYDDDEQTYLITESNWIYQTNTTFMKYVNFTLQEMTPEQLKQNPITVHSNQKLDTEEEESSTDEQESTISNKEEDKYSTYSDISKQDFESDMNILMILKMNKILKHLKHCNFIMYTTQQCMIKMI